MTLLDQPEARGLLITDARGHRDFVTARTWKVLRPPTSSRSPDVEEDDAPSRTMPQLPPPCRRCGGYDGARIAEEVARCARGATLVPGRRFDPPPLDELPFYVVETVPAITFPFAGIQIDECAGVRATTGGVVPGLLAAGSDIGGLYVGAYAGGSRRPRCSDSPLPTTPPPS